MEELERARHRIKMLELQVQRLQRKLAEAQNRSQGSSPSYNDHYRRYQEDAEEFYRLRQAERSKEGTFG